MKIESRNNSSDQIRLNLNLDATYNFNTSQSSHDKEQKTNIVLGFPSLPLNDESKITTNSFSTPVSKNDKPYFNINQFEEIPNNYSNIHSISKINQIRNHLELKLSDSQLKQNNQKYYSDDQTMNKYQVSSYYERNKSSVNNTPKSNKSQNHCYNFLQTLSMFTPTAKNDQFNTKINTSYKAYDLMTQGQPETTDKQVLQQNNQFGQQRIFDKILNSKKYQLNLDTDYVDNINANINKQTNNKANAKLKELMDVKSTLLSSKDTFKMRNSQSMGYLNRNSDKTNNFDLNLPKLESRRNSFTIQSNQNEEISPQLRVSQKQLFSLKLKKKPIQIKDQNYRFQHINISIPKPKIEFNEELFYNKNQKYLNSLNDQIIRDQINKRLNEQFFKKQQAYSSMRKNSSNIDKYQQKEEEQEKYRQQELKRKALQNECQGNIYYNNNLNFLLTRD